MKKSLAMLGLMLIMGSCSFDKVNIRSEAQRVLLQKNDGKLLAFNKAQDALDAATPGDTVILGPGRHQGPLVFKSSGITLKGERSAFVSAMSTWRPQLQPAPFYGRYSWTARIPFETDAVSIDGRTMLNIPESKGNEALVAFNRNGLGSGGRDVLKTTFTFLSPHSLLLISFPGNAKPEHHRIEAAPKNTSAIIVSGVDDCAVENLIVQSGNSGIKLENTNNSIVKNCLVTGNNCIVLRENARNCRIYDNDLTLTPDFLNTFEGCAGNAPWLAASFSGPKDKWAVFLDNSGQGNEIDHNYIYNVYKGIGQSGGIAPSCRHNRIDLCCDKADMIDDFKASDNWTTRTRFFKKSKTVSDSAPSGPVSGQWSIADDFLPLYERHYCEFRLQYQRFLKTGTDGILEFYAARIPENYDIIRLKFVRMAPDTMAPFNIKVFSEKGGLLLAKNGLPAKYIGPSELALDMPAEKNKRLKVIIHDLPGTEWYFPESKFFTPALSVKKETRLLKHDDKNPYKLFYDIPTWIDSIYISMEPLHEGAYATIENHNVKTILKKSGPVKVPYPGRCTIRLFFKDEMTFSIEGPSDIAVIAPDQGMEMTGNE